MLQHTGWRYWRRSSCGGWVAPEEIYASGVLEKVFQVRAHSVETAKGERQYLFSRL